MYQELAPNPALADSIKCFWTITRSLPEEHPVFEVLPDSYTELIFTFRADFSLVQKGMHIPLPNPFLVGLLEGPVYFHARGIFTIVGVRMYSWAVLSLLGTRPDEHTKRLENAALTGILKSMQALVTSGQEAALLSRLEHFFLERRTAPGWKEKLLFEAGGVMQGEHGGLSMNALVNRLRIPMRTLQRLFQRATGQSPKSLARKVRFERVRDAIWNDPDIYLTDLAYTYGFSDQAHFNREFRQFSGKTPGDFAREALIGRKYLQTKSVAFIQGT